MTSKKLIVFGCSYSSGLEDESIDNNWPFIFAKNNPEYEVINYARGGSSLQFSIAMLHKFLKKQIDLTDIKIVFQVTTPNRYTYNIQEILDAEESFSVYNNYKKINNEPGVQTILPNWERDIKLVRYQHKFYQDKIKFYPDIYNDIEFESQVSYVKNICDFTFYHHQFKNTIPRQLSVKYTNVPCIRSILGVEKFDEYSIDNGGHFRTDGLNYVANFVKDNLNV